MIRYLFNRAPGPWWARALTLTALAAALVVVLFGWVFPEIEPLLPFNGQTVS